MHEVDGLWIWADLDRDQLVLGNLAAAQEARDALRPVDEESVLPDIAVPTNVSRLGCYSVPGGPTFSLDVPAYADMGQLETILRPTSSPTSNNDTPRGAMVLAAIPAGSDPNTPEEQRGLWRDGRLIAKGPAVAKGPEAPEFTFYRHFFLQLLEDTKLLAILHGSAVQWRGRRILFVGTSGAGKSTLAAQLVADGGAYVGDDYVALCQDGTVVPVPMSPSIKEGSWPLLSDSFPWLAGAPIFHKEELRLKYMPEAPFDRSIAPADLLVFPKFSATGAPKSVTLSLVEVLLHLSQYSIWLEPQNVSPFVEVLRGLPGIALRHTPDLAATQASLLDAATAR